MSSPSELLSHTLDAYFGWFSAWHRSAFYPGEGAAAEAATHLERPASFDAWRRAAAEALPRDQPAIEKIAALHEQLHTLSRLVMMKTPDGTMLDRRDYDNVVQKYEELIQGLRRLERAFSVAASSLDPLTGLRSRTGLQEDLTREQNRFLRSGRPFCLVLMDIDHFKIINDTHGHDAGDKVLAAVADHVSRDLRSFDDAYRWGGEEFLLCLKEADVAIGTAVLERLRIRLAEKPVLLANGSQIPVTASFGFGVSRLDIPPDELIKAADTALYRAKHEGRNKVVLAELPPAQAAVTKK